MNAFYIKMPDEIEKKWAYPSGPHFSIYKAIKIGHDLRKKLPNTVISIVRRDEDRSEIILVDDVPMNEGDW
jgi:hypothetical protein